MPERRRRYEKPLSHTLKTKQRVRISRPVSDAAASEAGSSNHHCGEGKRASIGRRVRLREVSAVEFTYWPEPVLTDDTTVVSKRLDGQGRQRARQCRR